MVRRHLRYQSGETVVFQYGPNAGQAAQVLTQSPINGDVTLTNHTTWAPETFVTPARRNAGVRNTFLASGAIGAASGLLIANVAYALT